jgi:P-type Ca2+ transporter type 2C
MAQNMTDPNLGLDLDQVRESRERFGINRLTPLPREPAWRKLLDKFDDPIVKILIAAALLSMIVDLFGVSPSIAGGCLVGLVAISLLLAILRRGDAIPPLLFSAALGLFGVGLFFGHPLIEGMAVIIAVALATGVAFFSEYRSDLEFEALNREKDAPVVKAIRGGIVTEVPMPDIVVGDVVALEMGDEIPADGRIVKASEFMVDTSLLTGESEPTRKLVTDSESGRVNRGTHVVDGTAVMVVTEVGDATEIGKLARSLSAAPESKDRAERKRTIAKEQTPLQQKLADLAAFISRIGYTAAAFIFVAELIRGIVKGTVYWPTTEPQAIAVAGELLDYFITMVIIIVVAVPEGLPMSVTVSLALAMRKMTRANSLVRQLIACETIGSATVICTDKTGTLTENKMRVERVETSDGPRERRGLSPPDGLPPSDSTSPEGINPSARQELLALNAAVNSTATLDSAGKTIGNSTEGALLRWLAESGTDYADLRRRHPVVYQVHFSSERKRMTTVVEQDGQLWCLVKGAPDELLARCNLGEEERRSIRERLDSCARSAMRTLAFAAARLPADTPRTDDGLHGCRDELERGLEFLGFVAIRDPLRADVPAAIAECQRAGIRVIMITGDDVQTARAIGHDIGLVPSLDDPIDTPVSAVLTSRAFNELDDDALKRRLPGLRVVARARPLDKYRLVRLLQETGEVVAVTGDGTNDAPALKKADVGLAMGIAGTEVAKAASKIVLLDDSFRTIVRAVHWGRSLYENIQRFLQFQLTINVSALAITFLGILLFDVRAPFTVLQLLWINVIMDTFASIALCSEPPREGLMALPPKRRGDPIVTPAMRTTILATAAFFVVVMLGLLLAMKGDPNRPGFLAGTGPWAVEVGPKRSAIAAGDLVDRDGVWYTAGDAKATVHFTVLQATLFFTLYVFFQIWNQVNCRSLSPNVSGLSRLGDNPVFLAIAGATVVGQVLIVTAGGRLFQVQPLSALEWAGIVGASASVVVFAEIVRRWRLLASGGVYPRRTG